MHIFRQHQRALLLFIFLAIGVPMLFFGIPWGGQGFDVNGDMELGQVGGVPIMASELHRNLNFAQQRNTRGTEEPPTFKELHDQGIASDVMDEMISSALIRRAELKRDFRVEKSLVEERLRDDPMFKDDTGTFIPSRYNAWVTAREGMDWQPVYDEVEERIARQAYMTTVLAAANRVLDKEVEKDLLDRSTKIQMEYLKIEPKVTPTDEEIQQEYDTNQEAFRKPNTYAADYIAISLMPQPSQKVQDVLARARAGEDFAALADEVSDLETKNGGDLDWLAERETELEYRKPLFALQVGEVSEPAPGPNGFYIYKVEEERVNAETQQREVKARHIYIRVDLSEEERKAAEDKANKISEKAKELQSLPKAVEALQAELGLTLQRADGFTVESAEIAGIPRRDAFQFRRVVDEEATKKDAAKAEVTPETPADTTPGYPVIRGAENLYVAEVVSSEQGAIPPLAEIRDQVADEVRSKKMAGEEYRTQVAALAERIKTEATTLDQIKEKFPEIEGEIKETRPFTKSDYLFQEQVYLQTPQIFEVLEGKEKDQLAGPLTDFLGSTYFIALTNREEPTEEDKAKWDEEGKQIREQRLQMTQAQMLQDYLTDLRERELPRVDWNIDWDVYNAIVGIKPEDAAKTAAEGGLELDLPASGTAETGTAAGAETTAPAETAVETPAEIPAAPADTAVETPAETPAPVSGS